MGSEASCNLRFRMDGVTFGTKILDHWDTFLKKIPPEDGREDMSLGFLAIYFSGVSTNIGTDLKANQLKIFMKYNYVNNVLSLLHLSQNCVQKCFILGVDLTCILSLAGGYDERVIENKEHFLELWQFAKENNLTDHVTFVRSFSDKERVAFLKYSTCLLYTPSNEHFGLVPIEAMCMRCPVIACNSGGPLETVLNDVTGFLCDPNPLAFSTAMKKIAKSKDATESFGNAGFDHVMKNFSFERFSEKLDKSVSPVLDSLTHSQFTPPMDM